MNNVAGCGQKVEANARKSFFDIIKIVINKLSKTKIEKCKEKGMVLK